MPALAKRPRLSLPRVQPVFSRGLRLPRRSVGDDVGKWLSGLGREFKEPKDGPNWLGKNRPFPMNPTFKPPPPISDKTKDEIYSRYISDPNKFTIRILAAAYGISMKRVDAILRLKGMEKSWLQGKDLQTGFVTGMEEMLKPINIVVGTISGSRKDTTEADIQDEEEADDHARDRYQRLFWEPVVHGKDMVVPRELEKAKEEVKEARRLAIEAKSAVKLLTGKESKRGPARLQREKTVVVRQGSDRPDIVFKDAGGRFLDVEDRVRRMHEADRRRQAKDRRKSAADP